MVTFITKLISSWAKSKHVIRIFRIHGHVTYRLTSVQPSRYWATHPSSKHDQADDKRDDHNTAVRLNIRTE